MWKLVLKRRFLDSALAEIFTVCNSDIHQRWQTSFFPKCLKFDVDSRNWIKNWEKVYCFSDNCIWIGSCKFSQPWTGYLPSAVTVLTNTSKISPNTRGEIFQINFNENDEKTWLKPSHGDFSSFYLRFDMLTVEACSETALFRECSNQDIQSVVLEIH